MRCIWVAAVAAWLAACGGGSDKPTPPAVTGVADSYSVEQDQTLTVAAPGVLANDTGAQGLALYATAGDSPAHGQLALAGDGGFAYTPQQGFVGTDSFTYTATDLASTSDPVTVTIDVTAAAGAPTANADSYTTSEDTPLAIAVAQGVLANDTDPHGVALTASTITAPAHGTLALAADGSFMYTPAANYHGADSFVYAAGNGMYSSQATATLTVTSVNDAPVAAADTYTTAEDTPLVVAAPGALANDTDVDGDTLTMVVDTQPASGTLTAAADGSFTYTPVANFNGSATFSYHATDGMLSSATVDVAITVTPVNDAPVANAGSISVTQDEFVNGFVTASDIENDPLTFHVVTAPAHGTVQLASGTGGFRYTPAAGYVGGDSFTFAANDGMLDSAPATETITVNPAPPPEIDDFSPRVAAVGRPLQIWGRYFGATPSVLIDGVAATLTTSSKIYLVATIPSLAAGDHSLVVQRTAGVTSTAATLRIVPWIEGVGPRQGGATGSITVTGKSFGASGTATVDGATAATSSWSDTSVTLALPGGLAAGPHAVRLTSNGVTGNSASYYVAAANSWAPAPFPAARNRHTGVWTGNELVIWGGSGASGALATGARYDPLTDRYEPVSAVGAPSARTGHTAVWTGSEMLVWGGASGGGRYDALADTWTALTGGPTMNQGCAVWTGSEMIVWGGLSGVGSNTAQNTGSRFDPIAGTWSATSTANAPQARYNQICVWTGTRMIVMGGISAMFTGLSSAGSYDPVADTWTSITSGFTSTTSTDREYGVWTGSEVIVKAGRYDPALDMWTMTSTPPRTRTGATRSWTGSKMIVWGGCWDQGVGGCQVDARGEWYQPSTDTWGTINSNLAQTTSMDHVAVWTGTQMVAQGGGTAFGSLNSGIRYVAAADTYSPTAANIYAALPYESTVWTTAAAIRFGGALSSFSLTASNGWSGTPDTSLWTLVSPTGGPIGRFQHAAVWTGAKMIVWGGGTMTGAGNLTANTNTGGLYDPVANAWSATSTTSAPTARRLHTAVWTGSEMIVWGGTDGATALASGARYNPATNTWTAVSATNAPSARYRHVAVWTGSAMIVWGGTDGTSFFGDGASYNPTTDTWTPIAASAQITARAEPGALWTGTQLLVWGGQDSTTTTTATGAAYTPGGTWTALPTTNAPTARMHPAFAWSGSKLIVWGGAATPTATTGVATGAVYDGVGWSAMSTVNAPGAGVTDYGVWTGASMFVESAGSIDPRIYVP